MSSNKNKVSTVSSSVNPTGLFKLGQAFGGTYTRVTSSLLFWLCPPSQLTLTCTCHNRALAIIGLKIGLPEDKCSLMEARLATAGGTSVPLEGPWLANRELGLKKRSKIPKASTDSLKPAFRPLLPSAR